MTGKRKAGGSGGSGTADDNRDRRLAERLRENLRRRKAQARARRDETPARAPDDAGRDDED